MPPKKASSTSKSKEKSSSRDKKPVSKDSKKPISKDSKKPVTKDIKKPASRDKKPPSRDTNKVSSRSRSNEKPKPSSKGKTPGLMARKNPTTRKLDSEITKGLGLTSKFSNIPDMHLIQDEVADEYIKHTKMDAFLVLAIRETIKGKQLPLNPYPRIVRSLKTSLWHQICSKNYDDREKRTIKNHVDATPQPYNIATLKIEKIAFGFSFILERIN
jgi:hypothetical protein